MTRALLTCLRCGYESADQVQMRWPDLEREALEEGRTVRDIEVEVATFAGRHVTATETRRVPERYSSHLEPRCVDAAACLRRWLAEAGEPVSEPSGTSADEEVESVPWI